MTKILAEEWIKDYTRQLSIFPHENHNQLLHLSHSTFIGVKYRFFYDQIAIQDMIKLDGLPAMLNDLVEIRIFEPASKLRPLELMEQFFGVCHNRKTYYKIAPGCIDLKKKVVDDNTIIDRYHELYKIEKPSGYQKTTCKQDLSFILRKNPLSCIYWFVSWPL